MTAAYERKVVSFSVPTGTVIGFTVTTADQDEPQSWAEKIGTALYGATYTASHAAYGDQHHLVMQMDRKVQDIMDALGLADDVDALEALVSARAEWVDPEPWAYNNNPTIRYADVKDAPLPAVHYTHKPRTREEYEALTYAQAAVHSAGKTSPIPPSRTEHPDARAEAERLADTLTSEHQYAAAAVIRALLAERPAPTSRHECICERVQHGYAFHSRECEARAERPAPTPRQIEQVIDLASTVFSDYDDAQGALSSIHAILGEWQTDDAERPAPTPEQYTYEVSGVVGEVVVRIYDTARNVVGEWPRQMFASPGTLQLGPVVLVDGP